MFAGEMCLLFGEFLSRLFEMIPLEFQIFLFVSVDVHRMELFFESIDLLLNIAAHLQSTFLFFFLVSKIIAKLLDQIITLFGQAMNLLRQAILHLDGFFVLKKMKCRERRGSSSLVLEL